MLIPASQTLPPLLAAAGLYARLIDTFHFDLMDYSTKMPRSMFLGEVPPRTRYAAWPISGAAAATSLLRPQQVTPAIITIPTGRALYRVDAIFRQ